MNTKILKAFLLIFVLFLSVGIISAEELSSDEAIENEIISVNNMNDLNNNEYIDEEISTSNVGETYNFTWLDNKIYENGTNDAIIDLEGNIIKWDDNSSFTDGIIINKSVTLKNGIIDGSSSARIFDVENDGFLVLNNITLKNGLSFNGGAIHNYGNVDVINSNFINNNALVDGGVIYSWYGNLIFEDSNFINNTAGDWGGAIRTYSGSHIIKNSNFINNLAGNLGGAIHIIGHNGYSISDSSFINNAASTSGGAIYSSSGDNFTLNNSIFENNFANVSGGAIYNGGNDFIVYNVTFENNFANVSGGAIFNEGNGFVVKDTVFENNIVYSNGGAIYNRYSANFFINNAIFKNNYAYMFGGAIYSDYSNNFIVNNTGFESNVVEHWGGAVYNYASYITMNNILFKDNYANNSSPAIFNEGYSSNLNVSYSIFYNNIAELYNDTLTIDSGIADLSNNFWGTNNPQFDQLITNTTNYILDDFIIINLVLDANNETLYKDDLLPYHVIIDSNDTNKSLDINLLSNILLNIRNSDDIILDVFIAQENTVFESRNTTITEYPDFILNLYYFDALLDTAIYDVKDPNDIIINLKNHTYVYGEDVSITGNVTGLLDNDNITVGLYLDNNFVNSVLTNNGIFEFDLIGLAANNYNVQVRFNGTGKYSSANSNNANLTISKKISTLTVDVSTLGNLNAHARIYLLVNYGNSENITIKIFNDKYESEYNVTVDSGVIFHYPLPTLAVGTYNITVTFNGNENYTNAVTSDIFNITNLTSVNITFHPTSGLPNENMIIIANVTSFNGIIVNNGTLIISIDNVVYRANVTNGIAIFNITTPNIERVFNLDYSYNGLGIFEDKFGYLNFTVSKINTTLNVNIPDASVDENATITINIPGGDAIGNVNITVDNITYNSSLVNGSATITLPILAPGNYDVTVEYYGDNKYKFATFNGNLTVKNTLKTVLVVENVIMYYHDGSRLIALLTDSNSNPIKGVNITFLINGMNNTRTSNETGHISIALNLNPGEYAVVTTFNGYGNYSSTTTYSNVTIHSTISGDNIIKYFCNDTQYYASLIDSEGKPLADHWVIMNINGVMYNRSTNGSGVVKLTINLDPGTYIITVEHPISKQEHSNNITVLSRINGTDITKYYRNGTQYYATLVDDTGNPLANRDVVMNINGVFYTRKTDGNGNVMLSINLNPGKYIITVTDPLTNQTYSNNITVLPTLTGSDLEKNFSESAAYEVKLVDGQGNPIANQTITINIHGVFYNRTTGSDGIARLNINLDPGSYIATAYYNDYATSNQIQVKP